MLLEKDDCSDSTPECINSNCQLTNAGSETRRYSAYVTHLNTLSCPFSEPFRRRAAGHCITRGSNTWRQWREMLSRNPIQPSALIRVHRPAGGTGFDTRRPVTLQAALSKRQACDKSPFYMT